MYEGPDGRLLLIEAKGGTSELGVRRSADGTRMVQQGSREYLESLAATMTRSSDPEIRRLGAKLELALRGNPPNIDYLVVRQPFQANGSLAAPEVGTFDLSRRGSTQPTLTAAAVPDSQFRGDALPVPRDRAQVEAEVHQALRQLTGQGPTRRFTDHPAADGSLMVRTAGGERVNVRIEIVNDIGTEPGDIGVPVGRLDSPEVTGEGHYRVRLSARAPEGVLERALAHELTEIHRRHGASDLPDQLKPGGFGPAASSPAAPPPRLSPHDHGRLAELDVLARQIAVAQAEADPQLATRLQEETQRLLEHLGLTGDTPAAMARRALVRTALSGEDRQAALRLLPPEPAETLLRQVWESAFPPPHSIPEIPDWIGLQRQRLTQIQQDQADFLATLRQDQQAPTRVLGALDESGDRSPIEAGPAAGSRRRILYLGEGRLEHLMKYSQHLTHAVKVTTLLTPDDFTTAINAPGSKVTSAHLDVFETHMAAIRSAGLDLETGFNALTHQPAQGEGPYDQIHFDFPRVSLRNVEENIVFVRAVMEHMAYSRFMHQESEIIITLGLENQYFNPLQLLYGLRQGVGSGTDSAQLFELQRLALVHNQKASGDELWRIGGELLTVPVSIQMTFKPVDFVQMILPLP